MTVCKFRHLLEQPGRKDMFDLGTNVRLGAILFALDFVDTVLLTLAFIGQVLGSWRDIVEATLCPR